MMSALFFTLVVASQTHHAPSIHPLAAGAVVGAVAMGATVAGGAATVMATTADEAGTAAWATLIGAPLATGGVAGALVLLDGGGAGCAAGTGALVAVLDMGGHVAGAIPGLTAAYGVFLGADALATIFVPMTLGGAVVGGGVAAGAGTALAVAVCESADGGEE